jgi:hypothetical protein
VAESINLRQILEFPNLPGRAGQTLIMFVMPLVVALLVLVPGQGRTVLIAILAGLVNAWVLLVEILR